MLVLLRLVVLRLAVRVLAFTVLALLVLPVLTLLLRLRSAVVGLLGVVRPVGPVLRLNVLRLNVLRLSLLLFLSRRGGSGRGVWFRRTPYCGRPSGRSR